MSLEDLTYASTKPFVPHPTEAKVVKVYDGDTVWCACYIDGAAHRVSVRMLGYDTAEMRTHDPVEKAAAIGARDDLKSMVLDRVVRLEITGSDKYGRLLGQMYLDDKNINDIMLTKWGVPYAGGTKTSCDWSELPRECV